MAFHPVSGTVPQYSNENNELASGYYLKFYLANTTTPLNMATDSTGDSQLVKCKINPNGFPISNPLDNTTVFIPHVEESYRLVIYKTEADADANATGSAFLNVPSVPYLVGQVDLDDTIAALNLSNASTKTVGTSTGQLPEAENVVLQTEKPSILKGLDKSQWPTISNAADVDHDITFSAGSIVDSLGEQVITLSSALTKQIDAAWAAGDAVGGLFFGTVAADTTYHCFLIVKDSDGSVDSGFDTSLSAVNIPVGYTAYRRVHSLKTDSASNFQAFDQYGDTIELRSNPLDFNGTAGNTTRNLLTLVSIPGVEGILAKLSLWASIGGASSTWVRDVNFIDQAATVGASDITTSSSATTQSARISVPVDSSSQVARRSNNVSVSLVINSAGYIDQRVL